MAPDATTAQIALAYAQQARFDLEGVRQLEKAIKPDPHSALAEAWLAETQLFGYCNAQGDCMKGYRAWRQHNP
jgi:hypothetical protein